MREVLIAGGGLVGASLALAVADAGWQVLLVDPSEPSYLPSRAGFDLRVSALSAGNRDFLASLGLNEEQLGHPWHGMHVEAEEAADCIDFRSAELWPSDDRAGATPLGSLAENGRLVTGLWALMRAHSKIEVRVGAGIETIGDGSVQIGEESLTPQLLVGADGAQSAVRRLTGGRTWSLAPGQRALVTVVSSKPGRGFKPAAPQSDAPGPSEIAWQRFLPTGPLAFLPLGERDGRLLHSIVWSCPEEMAASLLAGDEAAFVQRLGMAADGAFDELQVMDERVSFPLAQRLATGYLPRARVVLVGDAAHVVHPLAGQGANMGLRDARLLADTLSTARCARCDAGDSGFLRDFERRAAADNLTMALGIAGQQSLWNAGGALAWLRKRGLAVLRDAGVPRAAVLRTAAR